MFTLTSKIKEVMLSCRPRQKKRMKKLLPIPDKPEK
jgi:hypothetical protein